MQPKRKVADDIAASDSDQASASQHAPKKTKVISVWATWDETPRWTVRLFALLLDEKRAPLRHALIGGISGQADSTNVNTRNNHIRELARLIFDDDNEPPDVRAYYRTSPGIHGVSVYNQILRHVSPFCSVSSVSSRVCF